MIVERAYAKINLTLDVVGVREDGYHLLSSVMQSVSLHDKISVEENDGIVLTCQSPGIPLDSKNTCYRAAQAFFEETGINGGAVIHIEKHIPSQAGIGGGSSDSAAVLRALNKIYQTRLNFKVLEKIGAKVGADVAFCVKGGTALCEGVGERIKPIRGFQRYEVVLVKPPFGISTPKAYKTLDTMGIKSGSATEKFLEALKNGEDPCPYISNDFEATVKKPWLSDLKNKLLERGAKVACMSGSGSCVFGLFENPETALAAASEFRKEYRFTSLCHTI